MEIQLCPAQGQLLEGGRDGLFALNCPACWGQEVLVTRKKPKAKVDLSGFHDWFCFVNEVGNSDMDWVLGSRLARSEHVLFPCHICSYCLM